MDVFGSMSDVDIDWAPPLSVGLGLGMAIGQGAGGLESGRLTRLSPRQAVQAVLSLLVEYGTSRIRSDGHLIRCLLPKSCTFSSPLLSFLYIT